MSGRESPPEGLHLAADTPEQSAARRRERGDRAERRCGGVFTREGTDVTAAYDRGAQEVLRLARLYGCTVAILKERSPACGSGKIYDGTFTKTLADGYGVAAELLEKNGVRVLGESQLEAFLQECGEDSL